MLQVILFCLMKVFFSRVQAFQAVYGSFVAWLRDTEQKIQRDDPLKLDLLTLSSGINYLKVHNY